MNHDPVTEPARQTTHLLPHPLFGLPTTVGATSSRCRETTGGGLSEPGPQPGGRHLARFARYALVLRATEPAQILEASGGP
jgi:hypothetical protein